MKIQITAIFRVSEHPHFEVIKRHISPEKFRDFRFGTFAKRASGRDSNPDLCDADAVLLGHCYKLITGQRYSADFFSLKSPHQLNLFSIALQPNAGQICGAIRTSDRR